jgi:hypothetical protein
MEELAQKKSSVGWGGCLLILCGLILIPSVIVAVFNGFRYTMMSQQERAILHYQQEYEGALENAQEAHARAMKYDSESAWKGAQSSQEDVELALLELNCAKARLQSTFDDRSPMNGRNCVGRGLPK